MWPKLDWRLWNKNISSLRKLVLTIFKFRLVNFIIQNKTRDFFKMSLEVRCYIYNWNTSRKENKLSYLCSFNFILDLEISKYIIYPTVSDNFVKLEYADDIHVFSHLAIIKGKIHFSNENLSKSTINLFAYYYAHAVILVLNCWYAPGHTQVWFLP